MKPMPHQVHVAKHQQALLRAALTIWSIKQQAVWHFPAEIKGVCLMKAIPSLLLNSWSLTTFLLEQRSGWGEMLHNNLYYIGSPLVNILELSDHKFPHKRKKVQLRFQHRYCTSMLPLPPLRIYVFGGGQDWSLVCNSHNTLLHITRYGHKGQLDE